MYFDQNLKKILSIAGSDSIGGAGLQADLRTIALLGCYGANAVTAVTAQDLYGVYGVHYVSNSIIKKQIAIVLKNSIDAIKIGMLGNIKVVKAVHEVLCNFGNIPIILDPVLSSTSGATLTDNIGFSLMRELLIPLAHIVTPNIKEAEFLCSSKISSIDDMIAAGKCIQSFGAQNVLVKGAHLSSDNIVDILITKSGEILEFAHKRIKISNTHGTGCRLSSALACFIARGFDIRDTTEKAIQFVSDEIAMMKILYNIN